jgi:hypothetical protein
MQVNPYAYVVPACCFLTAFTMNCLTMLFERDSQKFQFGLIGSYIQILAGLSDLLNFMEVAPIVPSSISANFSVNGEPLASPFAFMFAFLPQDRPLN